MIYDASETAVGIHELFSGPATLFCGTNELTGRKAASCGQFSLQRCPQGEQITTRERSFRTKLLQFRSEKISVFLVSTLSF